jgi:hypothetical protein
MHSSYIIDGLAGNIKVYKALLTEVPEEEYLWRIEPGKWNLLEIVCHLYDEEREDFRARVEHVLEARIGPPPPIHPGEWVKSRKYGEKNYKEMVGKFLEERGESVRWLHSLESPQWENAYSHPEYGPLKAEMFLTNWLAHDYLHFRQITKLKYLYLKETTGEDLRYAGDW